MWASLFTSFNSIELLIQAEALRKSQKTSNTLRRATTVILGCNSARVRCLCATSDAPRERTSALGLFIYIKSPPIRVVQMTEPSTPSHFAMFALLAILANLAIAVVSAQDPVPFNTSSTLFGSLTDCGTSGTPSCGGDPSQENLCCYEYPGVRCI